MRGLAIGAVVAALVAALGACGEGPARQAPSVDGADAAVARLSPGDVPPPPPSCEGYGCRRVHCAPTSETTVTGRVLAPNGQTPVPGALVYVPTSAPSAVGDGATCGCDVPAFVTATKTASDGSFSLRGVPVGDGVPLVVQLGKWRRVVELPTIEGCTERALEPSLTRLPKNRSEGDLPRIAVTNGACDALGCLLPKLGLDPGEMGVADDGDAKRVHVFRGAVDREEAPRGARLASRLWSDAPSLNRYDMVLMACECGEQLQRKGEAADRAMAEYLDSGGRILTTDFMFTWYRDMPSMARERIVEVRGGANEGGNPVRIGAGTEAGRTFAEWLRLVAPGPREGHASFTSVFDNLASVDPLRATVLASSASPRAPSKDVPRAFSLDFPVDRTASCGRAVHLDAHVNDSKTANLVGSDFPASCTPGLDHAHAALAYLFFHLATCDTAIPALPPAPSEPIR